MASASTHARALYERCIESKVIYVLEAESEYEEGTSAADILHAEEASALLLMQPSSDGETFVVTKRKILQSTPNLKPGVYSRIPAQAAESSAPESVLEALNQLQAQNQQISSKLDKLGNLEQPMRYLMMKELDPWERTSGSRSHAAAASLTPPVLHHYGLQGNFCQVIGPTQASIITAHLWPNHTNGLGLNFFDLKQEDLENPRNFLRLHFQIEKAFDHRQLTIVKAGNHLLVWVLDPSLMSTQLQNVKGGITFQQLHRRPLQFLNSERPFTRILAAHVAASFRHAEKEGWIQAPEQMSLAHEWATEMARHSMSNTASEHLLWWIAQRTQASMGTSASDRSAESVSSTSDVQ